MMNCEAYEKPVAKQKVKHFYENPTQVLFWELEIEDYVGGIAYGDVIICGCCGGAIEIEDIYNNMDDAREEGENVPPEEEVIVPLSWVPINEEIRGDEFRVRFGGSN